MPYRKFMQDHASEIVKNLMQWGMVTVAAITSFQQEVEWYLRILSLLAAISASIYTVVSIHRKNKQP